MTVEAIGISGTGGTTVLAHASNNTKGNFVQLSASTTISATSFWVTAQTEGTGNEDYLLDIATGAAASESVKVANLLLSATSSTSSTPYQKFLAHVPCPIPSGSRVTARCQSSTGGRNLFNVVVYLMDQYATGGTVETLGAATADSGGTSIDPGASANTEGAWTQITASTGQDIKWLCMAIGGQVNTARTDGDWLFDIATGAGGAESAIISDLLVGQDSVIDCVMPGFYGPFKVTTISAGTRVSVRAQCTTNDATDRLVDVVLYGGSSDFTTSSGGGVIGGPSKRAGMQ